MRFRHSGSPERDSSPRRTFPAERSGSRQESRAWVKRSRSINTLLSRKPFVGLGETGRGACQSPLMCRTKKPKLSPLGDRVAVESRHKPLALGYLTLQITYLHFFGTLLCILLLHPTNEEDAHDDDEENVAWNPHNQSTQLLIRLR